MAAAPGLRSLDVWSELDVQWLPRLAVLTSLSVDFTWNPDDYSGERSCSFACNASHCTCCTGQGRA